MTFMNTFPTLPHSVHLWSFIPSWTVLFLQLCIISSFVKSFSWEFLWNWFSHMSHSYIFLFSWTIHICLFKFLDWAKDLPQTHLWTFSPSWTLSLANSSFILHFHEHYKYVTSISHDFSLNVLPHVSHFREFGFIFLEMKKVQKGIKE